MTSKIWGGRFKDKTSELMESINVSINFDKRLASQDIIGSKAHCNMLVKQGIIPNHVGIQILQGLDKINDEISKGQFIFRPELEDIHMNIEQRLKDLIGESADYLHTARSRNDQVATDFKIWVREAIDRIDSKVRTLQQVFIKKSEQHIETIMPGFTHLQTAQPITLAQHYLAYNEMFSRDRGRLQDTRRRLNECPLGSGALSGTTFNIDRSATSKELGFDKPTSNSLDSVSDRDFALEFLSTCSIIAIHLSRISEEIVLWSSSQFSFITLPDSFSTGSSMMPQKRNPDAAELIRSKTGSIIGNLNQLLIVMKALPMAYSKDMQEDKVPVFETTDTVEVCLDVISEMLKDILVNKETMFESSKRNFSVATDLADFLVREKNIPFRESHHIVGNIIKLAEDKRCDLDKLPLRDIKKIDERLDLEVIEALNIKTSVNSKISYGGTSSKSVILQIKEAKKKLF